MRALIAAQDAPGGCVLGEAPEPRPAADHALVEVRATSLNRGEVSRLRAGALSGVPGWDVAGVVRSPAADGSGPPAGARVAGVVAAGAWAELVAVPTRQLSVVPDGVALETAASLPMAGLTALGVLRQGGSLLGREVLVVGAAGGVGRLAVQLAALGGASVRAQVGDARRAEGLEALGATAFAVGELAADGPRADVILESAGGASLAAALSRVAPGGTVVAFGKSSRAPTTFDVASFYGPATGARVVAFTIFGDLAARGAGARELGVLLSLVDAGRLDPGVSVQASWREAPRLMDELLARRVAGKAVLTLD